MYELENDDELLLLELERRDGIYSFIFHEMEDQNHHHNKQQNNDPKEEQTKIEKNIKESENKNELKMDTKLDVIMPSVSTPSPVPYTNSACLFSNGNSSSKSVSNGDRSSRSLSANDFCKIWQPPPVATTAAAGTHTLSFNFPFQMNGTISHQSRFKSPTANRPWQVRKAKPSFSNVYAPLVRNRHHKLKETAEYKNFEKDLKKVADLRQLFPLDPDVYAPFSEVKTEERKAKSNGVIVEIKNVKNGF